MRNEKTNESKTPKDVQRRTHAGIGPSRTRNRTDRPKLTADQIRSLGSLEAEILNILWEIGHPVSSMEVMEFSLYQRRSQGKEPASFATIATTLRRLADKGVILTEKTERTPMYWPSVDREDMTARILNNVSVTLLGRPLHGLLPRLLGRDKQGQVDPKDAELQKRLLKALEDAASEEIIPEDPEV